MGLELLYLTGPTPVEILLRCSAGEVRFSARTGPGEANLRLSEPVSRKVLEGLKQFLAEHLADDSGDIGCEYCWNAATHTRRLEGDGRYFYCEDHRPADAEPLTDSNRKAEA